MTCQRFAVRHENAAWWCDDERFCTAEDDFGHRADEHDHGVAPCKRRSKNPSLKRPGGLVAPE
jgi:hypothetical protein